MKAIGFGKIVVISLVIYIFILCQLVFADELQIPTSCYPKQLQSKFAERGYKIDLSANDRDGKSWGFLESKGTRFSIFTYKSVTKEELKNIQEIVSGG
jgi:hypothetical protein